MNAPLAPPDIKEIEAAAARLRGRAVVTPLLSSPLLDELLGCRLLVKAEALQRTGSFKFRGAYNFLAALDPDQRRRGVVTYSSGNHAQGTAAAAHAFGVAATIVMPSDAPQVKRDNTRAWGAELVLYDAGGESREARAQQVAAERDAVLVPPFDHPMTIAGQGTVGLEIASQAAERDLDLDAVLAPCGGGGLIAGTAIALAQRSPMTAVHAVEPEGFDDTRRSLLSGTRERAAPEATSFCDALRAPMPGALTFSINRERLAGGFAVSDAEVAEAMRLAFIHLKLVLEPGGASALAAVTGGRFDARGKTVAVVASGGNVDPETFARALAA